MVHLSSAHLADDIRIFHKECRSLAAAGYQVALVAIHPEDQVREGVSITALRETGSRLRRATHSVWRVYIEAARQKGELYHFHDPELIPVGLVFSLRGKRVIYDAHEDLPNTISYKSYLPQWTRGPLRWIAERLENLAVRRFTGVVAATPDIADKLRPQNRNTVVLRNYPLLEEFALSPRLPWDQRSSLVVHVNASMSRARGFREAIRALSLLAPQLDAKLVFAGTFDPELREEAVRGGAEVLGYLGRAELAELLGRARVGLDLVHPEINYLRALPTKLFEYMSAGLPAVVSDLPVRREIVEDARCGLLVNPLDPQQIAHAIDYLLSHPDDARTMGERGRTAILNKYRWDFEAGKLLAFYDSLFNASPEQVPSSAAAQIRRNSETRPAA